jgi:thiosulfate reductase/polysulfide reductase chain A
MKLNEHKHQEQKQGISRRNFLGAGAGSIAAGVAASTLPGFKSLALAKGKAEDGKKYSEFFEEIHTVCEMCVTRCGLKAKVKDGVVVKLEGNPNHPKSRGKLCPRGNAGIMTLYDPDRLKTPMIRVGERGSGQFRRASWDEALDYVADGMRKIKEKYGPQAMIMSSTHNLAQLQFENLLQAYGSPNYGSQRSLCFNAMVMAFTMTFGTSSVTGDYPNTDYIIYNGRNCFDGIVNSEAQDLVDAIARGTKVVVLDPRFTKTAAKSTTWLPVRPGGDLAFFLAVNNVIIREGWYDKEFIEKHTSGFEKLVEELQPYTPEWAEKESDIPAAEIYKVARDFAAAAPRAFAHPNWRTSNTLNSFQTERAIAILNVLVGNWKKPGGLKPTGGHGGGIKLGDVPQPPYPRVAAMRLDGVPLKYPLVPLKIGVMQELRDAVLVGRPYQAKGWLIFRQNPVMSLSDRNKTLEALKKLDLIVSIDIVPNDTSYYSDVVLPECTYLERYDPLSVVGNKVFLRQPAVPAMYDSKPAVEILKLLGERLGLKEYFNYKDGEDYVRQQLKPLNISLEELKWRGHYEAPSHGKSGDHEEMVFQTASGNIEIFSETLNQVGFDAVPKWKEISRPDQGKFYLLTGKVAQMTQASTQNNQWLSELVPENQLWIHPSAASIRGIHDGELVTVESEVGTMQVKAMVTEGIRPDCVWTNFGYGHMSKGLRTTYAKGGQSSNVHKSLTDPISGSQALSQTMVSVYPAKA